MDNSLDTKPPQEFRICRAGENRTSKGTYIFDALSAQSVMDEYTLSGNEKHISYEHSDTDRVTDGPAPAAGWWVPEIRWVQGDETEKTVEVPELWATKVRWTPRAAEMITNREYRYYSPTFVPGEDGRVAAVVSCALTNLPASYSLQPLVLKSDITPKLENDEMNEEMMKALEEMINRALDARLTPLLEILKKEEEQESAEEVEEEALKEETPEAPKEEEMLKLKAESEALKAEALTAHLLAAGAPDVPERLVLLSMGVRALGSEKPLKDQVMAFKASNPDLFGKQSERPAPKSVVSGISPDVHTVAEPSATSFNALRKAKSYRS